MYYAEELAGTFFPQHKGKADSVLLLCVAAIFSIFDSLRPGLLQTQPQIPFFRGILIFVQVLERNLSVAGIFEGSPPPPPLSHIDMEFIDSTK